MCTSIYYDGKTIETVGVFKIIFKTVPADYSTAFIKNNYCLCSFNNIHDILDRNDCKYIQQPDGDIAVYAESVKKTGSPIQQWDQEFGLWISCCYNCFNGPLTEHDQLSGGLCSECTTTLPNAQVLSPEQKEIIYNTKLTEIIEEIVAKDYEGSPYPGDLLHQTVNKRLTWTIKHKEECLKAIELALELDQ